MWTAAVSVAAIHPSAALLALAAAVAKEVLDLVSARVHRASVLAYLRTARTGTSLRIGPAPASPALSLSSPLPGPRQAGPAEEKGTALMPDDDLPFADYGPGLDAFCIRQRADWLAYAMTWTRNLPDAEDAVSHVVEKIYEYHARHGTICPDMRDPVGWSKTVIRNYVIDRFRRSSARARHTGKLVVPDLDVAEMVTDRIIARKALAFVESLGDQAHAVAVMAWIEGLKPREIAEQMGMKNSAVRKSLHQTRKKMRAHLGVAEPRKMLREETA